jgi:tRNA-dihydrouridine synthase
MPLTLISSPLQGFTDFRFRNTFHQFFGGIDSFYAPYIRLQGKLEIKSSYERDLLPQHNTAPNIVPQIMTNDADEFLFVAQYVQQLGYKELNWNLGCPYPMVTKRGMGSGLIKHAEKINSILNKVYAASDIEVSIKMRLGYENSDEIFQVLPILENYPIKNITIHPRIGKQLYKGDVDLDAFQRCMDNTSHQVHYNGDITSVAKFNELQERFPTIEHWMIGRGLISDPFLPSMIKSNSMTYPANRMEVFSKFHDTLFEEYSQALSGQTHVLLKMLGFWEYFAESFENSHKALKKIKKAKNIRAYEEAVRENFTL